MISIVDVPTEQATAATDAVLALLALAGLVLLLRMRSFDPWKVKIWAAALRCLVVASALGAMAHGVRISEGLQYLLWLGVYLSLGLLVAFFVVGTVHDLWSERASRRSAPIMVLVGLLFFVATQVGGGAFALFVIYEAVASSFALVGYTYLALGRRAPGAGLMAMGILVTLAAAVVQATRLIPSITLIWSFDHNGLFHILQMFGLVLIVLGLRVSILDRSARS